MCWNIKWLQFIMFQSRMFPALVLLSSCCISVVVSSPNGPPSSACDSMTPSHPGSPQTGTSPYTVTLDKTTYSPGEQIQVTLSGTSSFKGFMIQPRPSMDTYVTYGSFNTPTGTKLSCADQGTNKTTVLTHNSPTSKDSVIITWTAPSDLQDEFVFVFTVVQSYNVYWVKEMSSIVTYNQSNTQEQTTTQGPTIPTITQGTTQEQTTTQGQTAPQRIDRNSQCEQTLGCFPPSCETDCDYLITWKNRDTDVEFTLKKRSSSPNHYIAIGFSPDIKMGDDSVAECTATNGVVTVASSFNKFETGFKWNDAMTPSDYGITSASGSYTNGILSCTFRRKKNAALVTSGAGNRRRRAVTGSAATFFDLNTPWYLFVANGATSGGQKSKHGTTPVISDSKIDFTEITESQGTTPEQPATGTIKKDPGCGDSVGCFGDCEGDNCPFLLTWKEVGDDIDLVLSCKRSGNVYCAIGLSNDDKMGDDSVMACVSNQGVASVHVSYNVKDGRDNQPLENDDFGLTLKSGSHVDGVLSCSFSRKKTAALASGGSSRRKRAVPASASTYFDMNSDWTLLYAHGKSIGGGVIQHDVTPLTSSSKADFQSFDDIGAEAVKKTLVKVHGILMVVAWMLCATIGIFMARFYKDVWPEGREWCGQKRWFQVHRTLMMSVFVLTATAFVIIFVHVEGWAEIVGTTYQKSHPIIGTVVMGLALINPIMAAFRPHPGTPKRPIFKAAHTLVGVAAFILAIVNIFSGTLLSAANMPDYIRIILYAFCGWVFLIEICLHIYDCSKSSGGNRSEAYEMSSGRSKTATRDSKGVDGIKVFFLVLQVLVVVGLAVAVCVVIGTVDM